MEPKAAEVVPKSIIKEAVVSPTVPKATSEMIARGRQALEKNGFQEALKIVQSPLIEQRKISDKLEQFGIGRDDVTGAKKLEPAEQARRDNAEKGANLAKKFISEGYDKMDATEQDAFREQFLDASKLRPALEQEMQGMNDVQKRAFAERFLKDPRFTKEVRAVFDKLLNPDNKFVDVSTSQDAKETADLDLEDAEAEKTDHNRVWEANDRQLKEYEVRPSTRRGQPPQEGAMYQRLQGLTSEIQTARNDFNTANIDLVNVQTEIKKLRNDLVLAQRLAAINAPSPRPVSTIETDLRNATTKEVTFRDRVSQLDGELKAKEGEADSINGEHQALMDRRKDLDTEKRTLERKVKDAERKATKAQWALQDTMVTREGQETDLEAGFNSIFSEASDNVLNNELEKANTAYNEDLEVLKQQTKDNNEKAMYEALQKEMLGTPRRRKKFLGFVGSGEQYRPISKVNVNRYHDALINTGPEDVMKSLLTSRINPATGIAYTGPEITAILANKEYVAKMQPEVVKQILGRKMLVGGISPEDIHIVVNSQWGKDMLGKAAESNQAFRDAVEADMGPDALSSPEFHAKLAEKIKKHPWWLLLALGIPFLVGGAIGAKSLENIGK